MDSLTLLVAEKLNAKPEYVLEVLKDRTYNTFYGKIFVAEQAKKIFELSIEDDDLRKTSLIKWFHLSKIEVKRASNFIEIIEAFDNTPDRSRMESFALKKLYKYILKGIFGPGGINGFFMLIKEIFYDFAKERDFRKLVYACDSPEKIRKLYNQTEINSPREQTVLLRWILLCVTIEEVLEVYPKIKENSEAERIAIHKVAEMLQW